METLGRAASRLVSTRLLFLAVSLSAADPSPLDRISADDMRGNLSFLASDLLEGRDTPSRGLDIAAEFIASQFRRAGLEPAAKDYFQNAEFVQLAPDMDGFEMTVTNGKKTAHLTEHVDVQAFSGLDLKDVPVHKAEATAEGGVVLVQPKESLKAAEAQHPAAILIISHSHRPAGTAKLMEAADAHGPPVLTLHRDDAGDAANLLESPGARVTIHAKAAARKPALLRNVAGVLRGSDPMLANEYILLTAHYDHIGMLPPGEGDRINNGANDDGSGVVSVIEIANALAAMKPHPQRSILFLTFFGEEEGLYGSRYYAKHPLFPLKQTVAQINLEQLGRTDDSEGPQVGTATFTGFHFSDVPAIFEDAGKATGVKVYNNEKNGDDFFSRSDNQSLADAGVPAHTMAVSFEFPDYHRPGDEWQKIDYDNMVKVDRMVAQGLIEIANRREPPHWHADNPKAGKYVKAWRELHP